MRKSLPNFAILIASSTILAGCGSLTPKEASRPGTTYELTQPACHAEFSDGSSVLFPGKCITVVRSDSIRKVELAAGTCLKLGASRLVHPEFSRDVVYDVEVAGVMSTISQLDAPRRPWKGMVKGTCTPVEAPLPPLSLRKPDLL